MQRLASGKNTSAEICVTDHGTRGASMDSSLKPSISNLGALARISLDRGRA
jgi:hypothetical protein